jgi:hypothetical protein
MNKKTNKTKATQEQSNGSSFNYLSITNTNKHPKILKPSHLFFVFVFLLGFHSEDAIKLAAQTAKGAASILLSGEHPEKAIDKVTTPMGCTIAGLNQLEHSMYFFVVFVYCFLFLMFFLSFFFSLFHFSKQNIVDGFSSAFIKGIVTSAEKAAVLYKKKPASESAAGKRKRESDEDE